MATANDVIKIAKDEVVEYNEYVEQVKAEEKER